MILLVNRRRTVAAHHSQMEVKLLSKSTQFLQIWPSPVDPLCFLMLKASLRSEHCVRVCILFMSVCIPSQWIWLFLAEKRIRSDKISKPDNAERGKRRGRRERKCVMECVSELWIKKTERIWARNMGLFRVSRNVRYRWLLSMSERNLMWILIKIQI